MRLSTVAQRNRSEEEAVRDFTLPWWGSNRKEQIRIHERCREPLNIGKSPVSRLESP